MPRTEVRIYQKAKGQVPLLDWLDQLTAKVQDKCYERIDRLAQEGHELRRPLCDFLEDGIYELRAKRGKENYRMLYAFVGKNIVLLSHGCTKEKEVPPIEIKRAQSNLKSYRKDPEAHTYKEADS